MYLLDDLFQHFNNFLKFLLVKWDLRECAMDSDAFRCNSATEHRRPCVTLRNFNLLGRMARLEASTCVVNFNLLSLMAQFIYSTCIVAKSKCRRGCKPRQQKQPTDCHEEKDSQPAGTSQMSAHTTNL